MGKSLTAILLLLALPVMAQPIPKRAANYLSELVNIQREVWAAAPDPSFLAGQVEQETCITLEHTYCWNPRAELKTSRENGIGMGQFTRAYNKDGSIRFDVIDDLRRTHPELYDWGWDNRYNATYQLKALVLMNRSIYNRVKGAASDTDRLAFTLSAYNGGEGGLRQDRRLCANTPGCDQSRWKGNVERTSLKAKAPQKGYGKGFFEINREYVTNILDVRRHKYTPYFEDHSNG
ncbi:lytic murein transglycosylase [Salmonella enterica]|nr:lytic murein transglycosylase [Salmonella enterica]EAO0118552.1 lytic murein transglycosylase [Salmonella enterica]EAO3601657.1 lytic murein transglycosylase [Salmonella enterica]EAR6391550.1 lytic murein transglycosylase [Salmonella enterica]EAV1285314.1 lytic murein transglycosylase [Salmonella enterica]